MYGIRDKIYVGISYLRYRINFFLQAKNNKENVSVVIASAPKVGSTWLLKLLRDLYIFRHLNVDKAFRPTPSSGNLIDLSKSNSLQYLSNQKENIIVKSHSLPPTSKLPSNVFFITIFRDPRDVIISLIFHLANTSKEGDFWYKLNELNDKEKIIFYLNNDFPVIEKLDKWFLFNSKQCIKVFYEDLLKDPEAVLNTVIKDLSLNINDDKIKISVNNNDFSRFSGGRNTGEENRSSFFRKGIAGDWKNYFDHDTIKLLKEINMGKWNKLILDMGYESTEDWEKNYDLG